jgi:hypothetical protein
MGSIASVLSSQASAAAAINASTVDVGFTTNVAGKTYEAGVTYSGGQYVAEDGNITGAYATGTSVQTAENNLVSRIDVLV